jgi:predicted nucleic acid-binding protein
MGSQRLVIANTTPLINFAQIERLELLRELFGEIVVPPGVREELQAKQDLFPKAAAVCDQPFVAVREVPNQPLVDTLIRELHAGEAQCIALGLAESSSLLLLDDVTARTVAAHHGLRFTGSVGCLRLAKDLGRIPAIAPVIEELRTKARFWLRAGLVVRVLRDAGELPPL